MTDTDQFQRDVTYRSAYGRAHRAIERIGYMGLGLAEAERRIVEARAELASGITDEDALAGVDDAIAGRRPRF